MTLKKLLLEKKILIVVIDKSTSVASTPIELKEGTLAAWGIDLRKAAEVEYVIGIREGIAKTCFKIDSFSIRKTDGRVIFNSCKNESHLVQGFDMHKASLKTNHKEVQYLNI